MAERKMAKLFVSYRRDDSAYVAATINDKLRDHFGVEAVYFDIDTIPLGFDFRTHISEAVGKCDVFIAIIGDTWTSSVDDKGQRRIDNPVDSVRLEIEAALKRNIPVVPVLVGNARMPLPNDLPSAIQDLAFRNAAEVRPGRDLQQHLGFLVVGIEAILRKPDLPPQNTRPDVDLTKEATLSGTEPRRSQSNPAPEERAEPDRRQRRMICTLVLLVFLIIGLTVGSVTAAASSSDATGTTVMITIWLVGFLLVARAWRRWPRTYSKTGT
jgi:hypothetical protein